MKVLVFVLLLAAALASVLSTVGISNAQYVALSGRAVCAASVLSTTTGQTSIITVTVQDQAGNPVVGQSVSFQVTTSGATITPASALTDSSGAAQATVTGTQPGTVIVRATSADLACNAVIQFRTPGVAESSPIQEVAGFQAPRTGEAGLLDAESTSRVPIELALPGFLLLLLSAAALRLRNGGS